MLFFLTGQMTKCPAKVLSFLRPLLYSRQWSNSFSFTGNLHLLLTQIIKYQGSCKFSGANIWNTLPLALRSQHDLNKFGFDLKRHFMHQSIPPVPSPHTPSHLPALSVPGVGHLQIFQLGAGGIGWCIRSKPNWASNTFTILSCSIFFSLIRYCFLCCFFFFSSGPHSNQPHWTGHLSLKIVQYEINK